MVMEVNGLEPLVSNFTSDPDVVARTKALGAISCKYPVPMWIPVISSLFYEGALLIAFLVMLLRNILSYFLFSALIRNNKPGVAAFRLANGYGALRDALSSENVRFQR